MCRRADTNHQRIERIVLTTPRSETIREPEKVFLIDRIEYGDHRALEDLVFQSGDPEWALLAARLRYEPAPDGQRPIRSTVNSVMQPVKVALQCCLVVLPRHAVYAGSGTALERQERPSANRS